MSEGEFGDDVHIVYDGEVEVWTMAADGSRVVLATSGPGTCVGEMAAFDRSPRTASVTATRETRTVVIEGEDFKSLMATRPAMSRTVIELLLRRVRETIASVRSTPEGEKQPS